MWDLLQEHGNVGRVANLVLEEYDVPEDQLWGDLASFIERLQVKGLVKLHGEA